MMGAFTVRVSNISDYWEVLDDDGDLVADYVPASDIAQLFAAAPELLKVLRKLVGYTEDEARSNVNHDFTYAWEEACRVIAKAEGRGE